MSILRGLSKTLHHVSSVHFWLGLKAVIENFFGGKQKVCATFIYLLLEKLNKNEKMEE